MSTLTSSNLIFQCETESQESEHKEPFYFCSRCNIVVCTKCLIKHIIYITHQNPNEVLDIETAVQTYKDTFTQLKTKIQKTYTSITTPKEDTSSFDKLTSFLKEITSTQSDMDQIIIDIITKFKQLCLVIEKSKKEPKMNEELHESCKNEFITYINECNEIEKKFSSNENGEVLFKQVKQFEEKVESFIKNAQQFSDNVNNNHLSNNNNKELIPIKEIIELINQTDITKVINEFVNKIESFKEKLKDLLQNTIRNDVCENVDNDVNPKHKNNNHSITNMNNNSLTNKTEISTTPTIFNGESAKQKLIQKQSLNKPNSSSINNMFTNSLVITLKHADSINPGNIKIYDPKTKKISEQTITYSPLSNSSTKTNFPFKNSKYTHIGNNCIIITGGILNESSTNKSFLISIPSLFPLQSKITDLSPMIENRHSHNSIYIPKQQKLLICSGVLNRSSEYLDLVNYKNQWVSLPQLKRIRSNATMFCINELNVCCVGGYDHKENKYQCGYEVLNMNDVLNGWKEIICKEMFAISTMGVINKGNGKLMLVGGFQGGKKYLTNGLEIIMKDGDGCEVEKVDVKEGLFNKGVIFYSNQEFVKCGENKFVNFDFRQVLYEIDLESMKMNVIEM